MGTLEENGMLKEVYSACHKGRLGDRKETRDIGREK